MKYKMVSKNKSISKETQFNLFAPTTPQDAKYGPYTVKVSTRLSAKVNPYHVFVTHITVNRLDGSLQEFMDSQRFYEILSDTPEEAERTYEKCLKIFEDGIDVDDESEMTKAFGKNRRDPLWWK
jgi:hypothetical protein